MRKALLCNASSHWLGPHPGMASANERRRYYVTPPLIGWAHTKIVWYSFSPGSRRAQCCLSVLDMLFIPLVITPLVLLYWWGTWLLIDELCITIGLDMGHCGLLFLAIGIVGEWVYCALQNYMKKWFYVRSAAGRYVIAHIFLYISSFLSVSHWVGVWLTLDAYVGAYCHNCKSLQSLIRRSRHRV